MTRPTEPVHRSPFLDIDPVRASRRLELAARRRRRRLIRRGLLSVLLGVVAALAVAKGVTTDWGGGSSPSHPASSGAGGRAPAAPRPAPHQPGVPATPTAAYPAALPGGGQPPLVLRLDDPNDPVHVRFHVPPRGGLMFNLDTGRVLWRRNPVLPVPIASLTKMMTALLVVRSSPANAPVRITTQAAHYQGSGVGVLPRNRDVRLETLLYGLMLPSGNDAAIALAQHVARSTGAFIARMNQGAAAMGLRCTRFFSVEGLSDKGRSCAADLAVLARADLDQPRLAHIARTRKVVKPLAIKGGKVYMFNNNPLLIRGYPGVTGLKTGYTNAAGHCLVATATRHGVRLGVVLLHSPDTGRQAQQLLNRGFRVP